MPKLNKKSNSVQSTIDKKSEEQNTDNQLLLNKPYYCYLSELDSRLLYLHLIDYHKFYSGIESWIPYHEREKGCIKNFYNSVLMLLEKKESIIPLTLDFVKELHSYLSYDLPLSLREKLLKGSISNKEYQGFSLVADTNVTKAGLIELIHRIKKDNVKTGFVIATLSNEDLFNLLGTSITPDNYNKIVEKARQVADIRLDTVRNLSSNEINKLAEDCFKDIKTKENKWLLSPTRDSAKQQAEVAIKQFNLEIKTCKTPTEIIQTCVKLVHELEILHLFSDVNCRTNCLMLKALLWLQGIKLPVFNDPNCIDLFSIDEIVKEVKNGIHRADLIQNNQEKCLQQHKDFCIRDEKKFTNYAFINPDKYLNDISQPLVNEITNRNKQYREKINELEKLLETKLNEKEKSNCSDLINFISRKSRSKYKTLDQLQEIFAEFKSTDDAINFFQQVENINHLICPNLFQQAWNEKIQELKDLSELSPALTLYKELKPKTDQLELRSDHQLNCALK